MAKVKNHQPFNPITREDLNILLETIKKSKMHTYNYHTKFRKVRDILMIEIAAYCGLRPNEVCGIRFRDVDLDRNLMFIDGKNNKLGQDGIVPIPNIILKDLIYYLRVRVKGIKFRYTQSPYLFPSRNSKRISRYQFERLFRGYTKEAGINQIIDIRPNGQNVLKYSLYSLRHFCGTETWKSTHDLKCVQTLLRHKHIESSDVYIHLDDENKKEIINRVFPIAKQTLQIIYK